MILFSLYYSACNYLTFVYSKKVWDTLESKSSTKYHNLYLKIHTLLLVNVFETFRQIGLKQNKIHPAYYYMSPGLYLDRLLNCTSVELVYIQVPALHLCIEKSKRGDVSTITPRYAKVNNSKIPGYEKNKSTSYAA